MKKQAYGIFAILSLIIITAATSAYAQSVSSAVKIEIPFDFVVGNKKLPAGEYIVKPMGSNASGALVIQSSDSRNIAAISTHSVQADSMQDKTKLVFNRYGTRHFLSQVWTYGSLRGRELPKSHIELEEAKSGSKPETAYLISPRR